MNEIVVYMHAVGFKYCIFMNGVEMRDFINTDNWLIFFRNGDQHVRMQ